MMICTLLMTALMGEQGFGIISLLNDGTTVGVAGLRKEQDKDHYVALVATTDSLSERIQVSRGYEKTKMTCLINEKPVSVFIFHRLIPNKV